MLNTLKEKLKNMAQIAIEATKNQGGQSLAAVATQRWAAVATASLLMITLSIAFPAGIFAGSLILATLVSAGFFVYLAEKGVISLPFSSKTPNYDSDDSELSGKNCASDSLNSSASITEQLRANPTQEDSSEPTSPAPESQSANDEVTSPNTESSSEPEGEITHTDSFGL